MGSTENRFDGGILGDVVGGRLVTPRTVRILTTVVSVVVVWQLASTFFFDPQVLPSPLAVLYRIPGIIESGGAGQPGALFHLRITLGRVAVVTAVAMSAAVALGLLMSANEYVEDTFTVLLPFWMTIPTVVVVLVAMVMFEFSELSIVSAAIVTTTPFAAISIWQGTQNLDRGLIEMADAFGASRYATYRHIFLPSVLPAFFSSFRYLFSIVWKIVVIAEVFGIQHGMGAQFRFWFNESSVVSLLAYLVLFVVVMFFLEYGVIYPVERWVFRWRD